MTRRGCIIIISLCNEIERERERERENTAVDIEKPPPVRSHHDGPTQKTQILPPVRLSDPKTDHGDEVCALWGLLEGA